MRNLKTIVGLPTPTRPPFSVPVPLRLTAKERSVLSTVLFLLLLGLLGMAVLRDGEPASDGQPPAPPAQKPPR